MIFDRFAWRSQRKHHDVRPREEPQTKASVVPQGPSLTDQSVSHTVPAPLPIEAWLRDIHASLVNDTAGTVATYIPELANADPSDFGIAIATADGHLYTTGDAHKAFTIQSVSKPFVYGLALDDCGSDTVLRKVGLEPTGEAFNSIVLDEINNRPFNPMVNAGAIAVTALVKGTGPQERFSRIHDMLSAYAGRTLSISEEVFQSERATGHRNRAIAYLELNSGMIDEPVLEHLDLYFRQCSVEVTAADLAMMGATLANDGVNPRTGATAVTPPHVKAILSVMSSCGMYDFSGEWIYRVGLPAKSGVGGGIMAVLPGQIGIGVYSPRLDRNGNSHRGIEVCRQLSQRFKLHTFEPHVSAGSVLRSTYSGATVTSKRRRTVREQARLDAKGDATRIFELQGDLYFASAERILRTIQDMASVARFIVLDGRRVASADASALRLLHDFAGALASAGRTLVLAGFLPQIAAAWHGLNDMPAAAAVFFPNIDLGLEYCEDQLLAPEHTPDTDAALPLAAMDLLADLAPAQVALLANTVTRAEFAAGDLIIKEGDMADRLFMLASGSAAVHISTASGTGARMAAFGRGVAFGEFAFFDGGTRTADVVAETDVTCYVLTFEALAGLAGTAPDVHARIVMAIGRLLSDRLRRVTAEVRALA